MSWPKGKPMSPEMRLKMSDAHKGCVFSPETRSKLREATRRQFSLPEARAKHSRARMGEGNPNWKGGIIRSRRGYFKKHCPDHPNADNKGYVCLHRLILEEKLGRYLLPNELAHHIDFDNTNNSSANLTPMKNGEHLRYHQNIRYLFEHLVGA
jgi:hypothetical protein